MRTYSATVTVTYDFEVEANNEAEAEETAFMEYHLHPYNAQVDDIDVDWSDCDDCSASNEFDCQCEEADRTVMI